MTYWIAMSSNIVIFYGPLGSNGCIGGGESGNRKTVESLKKLGFTVKIVEKPYPVIFRWKWISGFIYVIQLIKAYLRLVKIALGTRRPFFVHISGFYYHLIYIEFLIAVTLRRMNVKIIYELRAGGADIAYKEGSFAYRYVFRQTLRHVDTVLCQGKKYLELVKHFTQAKVIYYPNYIPDELYIPYTDSNRYIEPVIAIVYFGRVTNSKNVAFALEICSLLRQRNLQFTFSVIGDGPGEYLTELKKLCRAYKIENNVNFYSAMPSTKLFQHLANQHFFLFPTKEKREGHSNSLTEAMSYGVVPIASNNGFNESVIGYQELVVDSFDAEKYADVIFSILRNNSWSKYSIKVHQRVGKYFTEGVVREFLLRAYL
jgi:glycosyltransferase involved in cell wall biosynthesis